MQAVSEIIARAVPLDRSDVDTDQIIPSDWLKRVERTGFGEGLFSEWRERSDFVLNQDRYRDAQILVAGPNFGTVPSRYYASYKSRPSRPSRLHERRRCQPATEQVYRRTPNRTGAGSILVSQ